MTNPWNFDDEPPEYHDEDWLQPWEDVNAQWTLPTWDDVEDWCGPEYWFWQDEAGGEE